MGDPSHVGGYRHVGGSRGADRGAALLQLDQRVLRYLAEGQRFSKTLGSLGFGVNGLANVTLHTAP